MKTTKILLQNNTWTTAGAAILILLLSIVTFFANLHSDLPHEMTGLALEYSVRNFDLSNGLLLVVQMLILCGTTILIRYLEFSNNIFRKKSILVLVLPPLIMTGSGSWFAYSLVSLFSLFFVFLLLRLLKEYRSIKPERSIFYLALMLSVFSMLDVDFLYLLPCLWIGMSYVKALNTRTTFITLLGIIIPYLYYIGGDYYLNGNLSITTAHFISLFGFSESIWHTQSPYDIIYWGVIGFFTLFAIANFFVYSFKENQRVRASLLILFWFWIASVLMLVFKCGEFAYIESLYFVISSIFISHYFTVANDRLAIILFYLLLTLLVIYPLIRIIWKI